MDDEAIIARFALSRFESELIGFKNAGKIKCPLDELFQPNPDLPQEASAVLREALKKPWRKELKTALDYTIADGITAQRFLEILHLQCFDTFFCRRLGFSHARQIQAWSLVVFNNLEVGDTVLEDYEADEIEARKVLEVLRQVDDLLQKTGSKSMFPGVNSSRLAKLQQSVNTMLQTASSVGIQNATDFSQLRSRIEEPPSNIALVLFTSGYVGEDSDPNASLSASFQPATDVLKGLGYDTPIQTRVEKLADLESILHGIFFGRLTPRFKRLVNWYGGHGCEGVLQLGSEENNECSATAFSEILTKYAIANSSSSGFFQEVIDIFDCCHASSLEYKFPHEFNVRHSQIMVCGRSEVLDSEGLASSVILPVLRRCSDSTLVCDIIKSVASGAQHKRLHPTLVDRSLPTDIFKCANVPTSPRTDATGIPIGKTEKSIIKEIIDKHPDWKYESEISGSGIPFFAVVKLVRPSANTLEGRAQGANKKTAENEACKHLFLAMKKENLVD
eukprot:m.218402 g.218402  ORF g.218402 m.218402 type:complete len:504 (-) comp56952_c0_seq1:184-1695(-)